MLCPCRYIVSYIGVGGSGEMSLRNADSARKVLNSTFLVQEYVEGGNLRKQVLEQVCCLALLPTSSTTLESHLLRLASDKAWVRLSPVIWSQFPIQKSQGQAMCRSTVTFRTHCELSLVVGRGLCLFNIISSHCNFLTLLLQMGHAHHARKHYSQEQALEWIIQIAKGLRYLHTSKPKVLGIPLAVCEAIMHNLLRINGRAYNLIIHHTAML